MVLSIDTEEPQFVTQKAYGLLGARIGYEFTSVDATISLWGKNLLDKNYANGGVAYDRSFGYQGLYSGDPRTYGVEFTKRF
jgi:iron complex outermembrane receptor protein